MTSEIIEKSADDDRMEMVKAFDDTKSGVKGLIDSGVLKVPKIFIRPSDELQAETHNDGQIQVPVIDLSGIQQEVVEQVRSASESWGFFQVLNHGIPLKVLDDMIDGIRKFNEMDIEEKKKYYSRDPTRRFRFNCNFDLLSSTTANWRDSFSISFPGSEPNAFEDLPLCCRNSTIEYLKHVMVLGDTLLEIVSQGLGLEPQHLLNMECSKAQNLSCHYYPVCPEPHLTLGIAKHSDIGFLTILLQNQVTGLQVLYKDQWINVDPIPGALVINVADLLQLVSNGRFVSSKHRVVANCIGPRISAAFFLTGPVSAFKTYGPMKELISNESPPMYREIVMRDYAMKFIKTGLDKYPGLDDYKL